MLQVAKSLREVLAEVPVQEVAGSSDVVIKGMAMDSRQVQPGDLFACVPGFNVDGHNFAAAAVERGAAALVVERLLPLEVPQVVVVNVRQVLGPIAANVFGRPAKRLELIGVTGTNGKTTITHLIEKIGTTQGRLVGLIGTLGARIGDREIPGSRTTPEAVDVQRLLAEMLEAGASQVVMEVSSHALDLGRVNGCEFDAGIFSNLTQDHLDYHKTMEEYLKAKARLFSGLHGQKARPKVGIINADDPAFPVLTAASKARVVSYGLQAGADYRAAEVAVSAAGVRFTAVFGGRRQAVEFATPGIFSVYNALAAFAWGVERGWSPAAVAAALADLPGVPGRFESVRAGQPFQVIVDYAHTPDGLENVLRTAREFTKGRLIAVFGCGGDRDRSKRPVMGRIASQLGDLAIVTSDNPRSEDPEAIIRDILAGVDGGKHVAITDRREAIAWACAAAKQGDTVLIAGKGHENYQIIGKETFPFDDRVEARQALRRLGYGRVD